MKPTRTSNAIKIALLLLLWLPLVALRFYTPARDPLTPAALPVQLKLQAVLAGRILNFYAANPARAARIAQTAPNLPSQLLAEGFAHTRTSSFLNTCYALTLATEGKRQAAAAVLKLTPIREQTLLTRALLQSWQSPKTPSQAATPNSTTQTTENMLRVAVRNELSQGYQIIALHELNLSPRNDDLLLCTTTASRDLLLAQAFAVFLTMAVISGLVYLGTLLCRPRTSQPAPPAQQPTWMPIRVLATFVALEWLMALCGATLGSGLQAAGLNSIHALLILQVSIYVIVLVALSLTLPHLIEPCLAVVRRPLKTFPASSPASSPEAEANTDTTMSLAHTDATASSASAPAAPLVYTAPPALTPASAFGLGPLHVRHALTGFAGFGLALLSLAVANLVVTWFLGHSPYSSNQILPILTNTSPGEWVFLSLQIVVLGPIFEEILFRGFLFGALRQSLRPWGAGLLSALVFSLTHGDPQAIVALTVLGVILAFLYQRSHSLWPAIIAHGLWNGMTTAIMAFIFLAH